MAQAIPYIALAMSVGTTIYSMTLDYSVENTDTGALINKAGTQSTRDVVYGRARVGSTILYSNVKNNDASIRLDLFSSGIAVSYIHQIYIDDVAVLANEENYRETTNRNSLIFSGDGLINGFDKQCTVQLRTGWANGASLYNNLPIGIPMQLVLDNSDGELTSRARGDYTCLFAITSKRIVDDEAIRIMSDQFKVNLEVSGVPVFDPRFSSDINDKHFFLNGVDSKYAESGRNPALCALDYITNKYYGLGIDFEFIDLDSFKQSATWCDDRKFKVDGQLAQGNSFAVNIESICKSAGLTPIIINGKLHLLYQDAGVSSMSFNYDNIVNNVIKVKEQSSGEYINAIEVEYKNSELNDEKDLYVIPDNIYPLSTDPKYPSQVQKDGFLNQGTLELPMVRLKGSDTNNFNSQVKYFANRELLRQQYQKEIEIEIDLDETDVKIFDIIDITNKEYGWDKKEFRITSMKSKFTDTEYNICRVLAKEHNNDIYKGTIDGTNPSEKPNEEKVVTAPTNLKFTQYNTGLKAGARLTWSRTYFETNSVFIVEYKKSSAIGWTYLGKTDSTQWDFPLLNADMYDFRVATFSNLYGSSDFTLLLNQEISSYGQLPNVTNTNASFLGQNCLFTWDNMLDKKVVLPANPDPNAPKDPIVADYFSHYQVDIFHGNTYTRSFNVVGNNFVYQFEDNKESGLSREVRCEIYIVAVNSDKSQLGNTSKATGINYQHSELSGFKSNGGQLSTVSLQWNISEEPDYKCTIIRRKKGELGEYVFEDVSSNFYTDVLPSSDPDNTVYYYNVAAYDIFDRDNLNWSDEISVTKTSVEGLKPEFVDELKDIRNPDVASTLNDLVINTTNTDKSKVAGIGLFAPDESTDTTKFIVAADEIVLAPGGEAEWQSTKQYNIDDRACVTLTETKQQLYKSLTDNINSYPVSSPNDWELLVDNTYEAAFYFDTTTNKMVLNEAVIGELNADKITTGTLDADRIRANSITGDKVSATTTIQVGKLREPGIVGTNGETIDVIDGIFTDAVRLVEEQYPGKNLLSFSAIRGEDKGVIDEFGTVFYSIGNQTLQTGETVSYCQLVFPSQEVYDNFNNTIGVTLPNNTKGVFTKGAAYPWPDGIRVGSTFMGNVANFLTNDMVGIDTTVYVCLDSNVTLLEDFISGSEPVLFLNGSEDPEHPQYGYTIVSGAESPQSASFTVTRGGLMTARNANIEGTINATSGNFSGTLFGTKFEGTIINGTEMNSNLFKGGTIIASTIYASDTEILADPYGDGTVTYYESQTNIPVSVLANVVDQRSAKISTLTNYQSCYLLSAADNKTQPDQRRSREMVIPANTITLSIDGSDEVQGKARNGNDIRKDGNPRVEIRYVNSVTGSIIDQKSVELILDRNIDNKTTGIAVSGIYFDISYKMALFLLPNGSTSQTYYAPNQYIGYVNIKNRQGTLGVLNDNDRNGYYEISLAFPQCYGKTGGKSWKPFNKIYTKNVYTRVNLNNE